MPRHPCPPHSPGIDQTWRSLDVLDPLPPGPICSSPLQTIPYTGNYETGTFRRPLPMIREAPCTQLTSSSPAGCRDTSAAAGGLPDQWTAPFLYEDRRHLFYVTTTQSTGAGAGRTQGFGLLRSARPGRLDVRPPLVLPARSAPPPGRLPSACHGGDPSAIQRYRASTSIRAALPCPDGHLPGPGHHPTGACRRARHWTSARSAAMNDVVATQRHTPADQQASRRLGTLWNFLLQLRRPSPTRSSATSSAAEPDLARRHARPRLPRRACTTPKHPGRLRPAGSPQVTVTCPTQDIDTSIERPVRLLQLGAAVPHPGDGRGSPQQQPALRRGAEVVPPRLRPDRARRGQYWKSFVFSDSTMTSIDELIAC